MHISKGRGAPQGDGNHREEGGRGDAPGGKLRVAAILGGQDGGGARRGHGRQQEGHLGGQGLRVEDAASREGQEGDQHQPYPAETQDTRVRQVPPVKTAHEHPDEEHTQPRVAGAQGAHRAVQHRRQVHLCRPEGCPRQDGQNAGVGEDLLPPVSAALGEVGHPQGPHEGPLGDEEHRR